MTQQNFVSINSLTQAHKDQLKKAVQEMNDSMTRVAAEKDLQKTILTTLHDNIGVDKKIVRRMAKAYYKANFNQEVEDNNVFEEFYNSILK